MTPYTWRSIFTKLLGGVFMKYALTILLFFVGFFAQAEGSNKQRGFFSLDFGSAVNSKLTQFSYPVSLSYGGSILEDRYVGAVEIGISSYRQQEFVVPHLLLKYNYDFMTSDSSNWTLGVDTALHLGGTTVPSSQVVGEQPDIPVVGNQPDTKPADVDVKKPHSVTGYHRTMINLYVGHDLGLLVKKRISKSFVVLFRGGVNNTLTIKPRFVSSLASKVESPPTTGGKVESKQGKKTNDEQIKVNYELLNPNFYLSTGIEWYL